MNIAPQAATRLVEKNFDPAQHILQRHYRFGAARPRRRRLSGRSEVGYCGRNSHDSSTTSSAMQVKMNPEVSRIAF